MQVHVSTPANTYKSPQIRRATGLSENKTWAILSHSIFGFPSLSAALHQSKTQKPISSHFFCHPSRLVQNSSNPGSTQLRAGGPFRDDPVSGRKYSGPVRQASQVWVIPLIGQVHGRFSWARSLCPAVSFAGCNQHLKLLTVDSHCLLSPRSSFQKP